MGIDRRCVLRELTLSLAVLSVLGATPLATAQLPDAEQGNVVPNDSRLGKPVPASEDDELTLISFNVRNWGARDRGLKHYEAIADLVDEADLVVFQEVGLGVHDTDSALSQKESRRLQAIVALMEVFLGPDWSVALSETPTGTGSSAESSLLAWRRDTGTYTIEADWKEFVDLAPDPRRDMAVWDVTLTKGSQTEELLLGSVHLKPHDPFRGEEMIKVADWLEEHEDEHAIACGDFNWGYRKKSGVVNYKGEDHVEDLHDAGTVCVLFRSLSSRNGAKSDELRTNMGFRKTGYFYDQFLLSASVAGMMSHGGELLEDCGIVAFGVHNKVMKDYRKKLKERRLYGLGKFIDDYQDVFAWTDEHDDFEDAAKGDAESTANDEATYLISDHRLIWMQIKPFGSSAP